MDAEVVKAFKQQQELINEVVKKLDDYFLTLHNENSEAIDDLTITLLGGEEAEANV